MIAPLAVSNEAILRDWEIRQQRRTVDLEEYRQGSWPELSRAKQT